GLSLGQLRRLDAAGYERLDVFVAKENLPRAGPHAADPPFPREPRQGPRAVRQQLGCLCGGVELGRGAHRISSPVVSLTTANRARKLTIGQAARAPPMNLPLGSSPSLMTRSTWRSDMPMVLAIATVVFSPRSAQIWANLSRRSLTVASLAVAGNPDF